jgi:pimeloyl-ACP methyl ester carboxylesterase
MRDATLTTSDGTTIGYTDLGDPGGTAVLFFHGAPGGRLSLEHLEPDFARSGQRVISPNRSGYGHTSFVPGRSRSDAVDDAVAVLDHLAVGRFVVAGHSSGGPYAVETAARFPDRVRGGVVVGGLTDMAWPEAWHELAPSDAEQMRMPTEDDVIEAVARQIGADGSHFLDAGGVDLPAPDVLALDDPAVANVMVESLVASFEQGVVGYAQDTFVEGRPWTFRPSDIRCPFLVAHGDHDDVVPFAHSRHTMEIIPEAALRVLPGHGHVTILRELPALIDDVLSMRTPTVRRP